MAYQRPGIEVIQDFQNQSPALALPTLPNLIIGPAFQIMADADVGQYNDVGGTNVEPSVLPFTGLAPGAIVDLADAETTDLPSVLQPVGITLENVYLVQLAGTVGSTPASPAPIVQFDDASAEKFIAINPGAVGAPLYYLQLVSGTGVVTADEALNLIVGKTSPNQLLLAREVSASIAAATYRVLAFYSSVVLDPADFATLGISKGVGGVTLPANLESNGQKVAIAEVHLSWRALRPDLADTITTVSPIPSGLAALEAVFGVGQVVPANILAYGMLCAMNNTTTPINGVGLKSSFFGDESAAFLEAIDFVGDKDVYAIAICSQVPVDHQALSASVTGDSVSTIGRERIGFINRQLMTESVITPSSGIGTQTGGAITTTPTVFRDPAATFITNGVHVGDFIEISPGFTVDGTALTTDQLAFVLATRFFIASVDSETQLTLQVAPTPTPSVPILAITYRVTRNMTLDEQASYLAGYSTSFANRRLYNVWPDQVAAPVNGVDTILPGYFASCAIVGFVSGLPSQQGITNLAITGFDGRVHGKDHFSDTQLDTIAGGGTLILEQDVAQAPLYVRHQLSTDMSSVQFQELSVTKNVDLMARFFRALMAPYIGPWNVTQALIDHLKTVSTGGINFLKTSAAPRCGSALIDGTIANLTIDPNEGDQVLETIAIVIPLPFNHLKLTLVI